MTTSLFKVISSIMNIKRWNTMPQIDVWNEAENIAYYTHMAYAIARESFDLDEKTMETLLTRCLLKSLNKHILSDISIKSRDKMKEIDPTIWSHLILESAKEISKSFPRGVSKKVYTFLTLDGDYEVSAENCTKELIEDLIKYCQYMTALEECTINMKVFETKEYQQIRESILSKIQSIPKNNLDILENSYKELSDCNYFETIKQLKNILRWNRVVRSNESTVMGHTFVVAILTIVFTNLEIQNSNDNLRYKSILKALFHDLPESLTGDVITPVKDLIDKEKKNFWSEVEQKLLDKFLDGLPEKIRVELRGLSLSKGFNDDLNSMDSLVKSCDQLALIFECLYEREWGSKIPEMEDAYENYTSRLQNSEWNSIREFTHSVLIDFPK